MSMNQTPESSRTRIAVFGRANAGKSSLINAMTGQPVSIVSDQRGTTTDPVKKAMELLPLGPVVLIDTAGLDDETELGQLRVGRAMEELARADIVLFVADAAQTPTTRELDFLSQAQQAQKSIVIAANKSDLSGVALVAWEDVAKRYAAKFLPISAQTRSGVGALKNLLASLKPGGPERILVRDLVPAGELCVLVVPLDSGAPKGRLILPQQQVIRDLLEGGAMPIVTRDAEYPLALQSLKRKPALVVTDSQVFGAVAKLTPPDIRLTSFSMLFARYKGDLEALVCGAGAVDALQDGDSVLISEGCTHHRQCEDIGTVKIPGWLEAHTQKSLRFSFTSGAGFPEDLSGYRLVVHCGGCMLNRQEMESRLETARRQGVPIVNYGVLIARMNGILNRCLQPFTAPPVTPAT